MKEEILKELEAIKKLLILIMSKNGFKREEIAKACGISTKTIQRMFSGKNEEE